MPGRPDSGFEGCPPALLPLARCAPCAPSEDREQTGQGRASAPFLIPDRRLGAALGWVDGDYPSISLATLLTSSSSESLSSHTDFSRHGRFRALLQHEPEALGQGSGEKTKEQPGGRSPPVLVQVSPAGRRRERGRTVPAGLGASGKSAFPGVEPACCRPGPSCPPGSAAPPAWRSAAPDTRGGPGVAPAPAAPQQAPARGCR